MSFHMSSLSTQRSIQSLPKLAANGSNWILYKGRVMTALGAKGLGRYLSGTVRVPPNPPVHPPEHTLTTKEAEDLEAALVELDKYWTKQHEARHIILSSVPEFIQIKVIQTTTVKEMWEVICKEHEGKSIIYQMEMRRRLQNVRCEETTDVREHLHSVEKMRAELVATGATISDEDFTAVIVNSLPSSYDNILSILSTTAKITQNAFTSRDVISLIEEEYIRRQIESGTCRRKGGAYIR